MMYLCIDGGTTNTRINLVSGGKIIDRLKIRAGAGGDENLKTAVKQGIYDILSRNGNPEIYKILACGMLTCERGLFEVPHIEAPAGIKELHGAMREVVLEDISPIPFVFIPGVKILGASFENTDMMRGEETELIGLDCFKPDSVYVLPGSHSKVISTDGECRISEFSTLLTGEMASALSSGTILKASVGLNTKDIDPEYLLKGFFMYAAKTGLTKPCLKRALLRFCMNSRMFRHTASLWALCFAERFLKF